MSPVFKHIDQLRSVIKKNDYARFLTKKTKGKCTFNLNMFIEYVRSKQYVLTKVSDNGSSFCNARITSKNVIKNRK